MSRQRGGKTLIITDDEEEEEEGAEELNPFSFKEFIRWKDHDQHQDQIGGEVCRHQQNQNNNITPVLTPVSALQTSFGNSEVSSCFLSEPHMAAQEEEWGRSLQSGVDSTSSLCTEEEETRFSSNPEGGENYEGDDETSMNEAAASCRGRSSLIQQLGEENVSLRRTIRELQRTAEANQHRVSELSQELLQRRRQEEKEVQDLESMVQSVEQNLHLMTRRAVKAENSASKLKAALQQLQVEADALRSENNHLKAAESQVVMTMRQNAQVASEYLSKTATHAHSSIRQLLGEAETLRLVSQLLRSIDKVSTVHADS